MRLTHPIGGALPPTAGVPLAGLTPEQAQAVTYGEGPLLLIAGPGAGKTRTLTYRLAHLLDSGLALPEEVLAVTFSVRTAGELRLRLADLLGQDRARAVLAATFHSVCARLLREHAHLFGRSERYTIYDQGDMRRVIDWTLADAERAAVRGGTGPLRAAAVGGGAGGDLAGEEPAARPRDVSRVGGRSDRAGGRRGVARVRPGAAAFGRVVLR
jgi:hypothetical protein